MKTRLFSLLVFFVAFTFCQNLSAANAATPNNIEVVIGEKKIWLVADESPVKDLTVLIFTEKGKTIVEKHFSSKMADWSLDLSELPVGKYTIKVGDNPALAFSKGPNRA